MCRFVFPVANPIAPIIPLNVEDNTGLRDTLLAEFQRSYFAVLRVKVRPEGELFLHHIAPLSRGHLNVGLLRAEVISPLGVGTVTYRAVVIAPSGEFHTLKEVEDFRVFVDWVGSLVRGEVL